MTSTLLLPPGTPPPSPTAATRNALPTCKSTTAGEEVHEDQDKHHGRRIWAPCSARSTYSTRRHSTSCRHHGLSCSRRPSLRRGLSCSRPPRHPLSPHATSVAPPRPWAAPPRAFSLLTRALLRPPLCIELQCRRFATWSRARAVSNSKWPSGMEHPLKLHLFCSIPISLCITRRGKWAMKKWSSRWR
jgi:hypothetical protein